MNKKLIALAVAGACTAPAAMAQTANPVTLYGRVYVTLEQVEAKGGAGTPSRTRIEDQASLFGIRGTEDLGGGLRAFFQLETAFNPTQNNTTFAARNSGVGLQGGFGSIVFGRWDMPFKSATIAIDPYGDLTLSGITGTLSDGGNFDRRDQNVAQYWSPTMGGFAFRLAGTANERKDATTNPRDYGANLTFTRGPIYVFAAWEKHKDNNNGNALGFVLVQPPATGQTAGVANYEEEAFALGGSFAFGPIKIGVQHQQIEKNGRQDTENWMGNLVWTIGKNQLIFQHMRSEGGQLNATTTEPDCESNSIGYQYNFTRRTFFIGSYVRVTNENGSTCNFGANRLAIGANQDPQGVFVGLRHVF
jgi:predicted porin